ncbi:MAG: hypothetical protein U0893_10290 [Chloroflexota bacterium]
MPAPRYLMAAALLAMLTLAPLLRWPGEVSEAHAQTDGFGRTTSVRSGWWSGLRVLGVAMSNQNERDDRDKRKGREENDNKDDNDDDNPPPAPPPPPRQAPPPPAPVDNAGACLSSGGSVSLTLGGVGITAKAFQDGLALQLERVDGSGVPGPPGSVVGETVFRLSGSPCGGGAYGSLPNEVNLGVSYRNRVGESVDRGKLSLVYFDGQRWSPATKQANDPGANYISASVTAVGVYALVQQ